MLTQSMLIFLIDENRLSSNLNMLEANSSMIQAGLASARILHKLQADGDRPKTSMATPLMRFVNPTSGAIMLELPEVEGTVHMLSNEGMKGTMIGTSYIDAKGHKVNEPMDFTHKNYISLTDLQNVLLKLIYTDKSPVPGDHFHLDEDLRTFLLVAMAIYPRHSTNPLYQNLQETPDNWCKFFLPGLQAVQPEGYGLQVINKVGIAYGHLVDNAFISYQKRPSTESDTGWKDFTCTEGFGYVDPLSDSSCEYTFLLTAVVYANENECLNDDIYEEELAEEYLVQLASAVGATMLSIDLPKVSTFESILFDLQLVRIA